MNFKENPFYILKANFYDDKSTLSAKAEELVFEVDDDLIQSALKDLTNPKRRLFWELRWLLCVDSASMQEIYSIIDAGNAMNIFADSDSNLILASGGTRKVIIWEDRTIDWDVAESLAVVNTHAFYLEHFRNITNQASTLHGLAISLAEINIDNVLGLINECREYASMPEASRGDVVDAFNEYVSEIKNTLSNALADKATNPAFLKKVLDYDRDYMKYGDLSDLFSEYKENAAKLMMEPLEELTKALQNSLESSVYNSSDYLKILNEFPRFIDAAIWVTKHNKEEHALIEMIIIGIRNYAIKLANEMHKFNESKKLVNLLKDKCPSDFSETKAKLTKDCNDIDELISKLEEAMRAMAIPHSSSRNRSSNDNSSAGAIIGIIAFVLFMLVMCTGY